MLFFRPSGLIRLRAPTPRLTPWAAFFRRFAAGLPHYIHSLAASRLASSWHAFLRRFGWSISSHAFSCRFSA